MRIIKKGATSQSIYLVLLDSASTTGGRKTGIAFNTASLVASYVRNGAARTAITLATQTASGAYSSGGFVEVDATNTPGLYRLDVPDAALASGVDSVVVTLKGAAGMVGVEEEIQLVAVDLQDTVRMGMTALPNAAAEAAGGLYTRGTGAGQINQPANGMADANVVRWLGTAAATPATAGVPKVAIEAAGDFAQAAADKVWGTTTRAITDKAGFALSSAGVQAIWDAATSALTTAGSIGKLLVDNINATISSRMATFALPTNFSSLSITGAGLVDITQGAADKVWGSATRTLTSLSALAAQIASAVWDAVATSYNTALSMGNKLNAAGSAGDPWTTALPGAYGAGTAGKIVGDNLNATVSSRSSHTAADVWTSGTRTLTSFGTLIADIWAAATRTLTAGTNIVLAKGTGVTGFTDLSAAQVNAEVVDALATDTYAESAGVPAATASLKDKIGWLATLARNKLTQTATTAAVRNDADSGNVATAAVSDDGTTYTRGEWS